MELEDTSIGMQTFALNRGEGTTLKLVFDEFTDFYGHITIYRIEVWGLDRPLGTYKNHMFVNIRVMVLFLLARPGHVSGRSQNSLSSPP
jgi:hypothetical protein